MGIIAKFRHAPTTGRAKNLDITTGALTIAVPNPPRSMMPPRTTTPQFKPRAANYRARVEDSFARQRVMKTLGISLIAIAPGEIELKLPFDAKLTQQHGFMHAGVISTALDSACGYAAFSLMPEDAAVLTVEFKVNLLSPAKGAYFTITGRVVRPGKSITVAQGEAWAHGHDDQDPDNKGERKQVAAMTATLMAISGRADVRG